MDLQAYLRRDIQKRSWTVIVTKVWSEKLQGECREVFFLHKRGYYHVDEIKIVGSCLGVGDFIRRK